MNRSMRPRRRAGIISSMAGIDGGVFAADARTGNEAEEDEAPQVPGEGGKQHADQVDRERDKEERLAAETVRQIAEEQRAEDCAGQVERRDHADLGAGEVQRLRLLEHAADGALQRHLQAVEYPGDAKRQHDQPVELGPWQPVHAGGDECGERSGWVRRRIVGALEQLQPPLCRPKAQPPVRSRVPQQARRIAGPVNE